MKVTLTKEQEDLLKMGTVIGDYHYLPFWFKKGEEWEVFGLDYIPNELKEIIERKRNY